MPPHFSLDIESNQPFPCPQMNIKNPTAGSKQLQFTLSAEMNSAPTKVLDGKTLYALPIFPASPFHPTDSRSAIKLSYDAAKLIADYEAAGRRIPLDIEHYSANGGGDTRARGWSVALTTHELEPDAGLQPGVFYGWFELTTLGEQERADKLYGYTSAAFRAKPIGKSHFQVTKVTSLGQTNNPASSMPFALTAQNEDFEFSSVPAEASYTQKQTLSDPSMKDLIELLQLSADADEAAIIAAVAEHVATKTALTAAGFSDVAMLTAAAETTTQLTAAQEQVTTLSAQVNTLTSEINTFRAEAADKAAVDAVETALSARKITPAQKDAMLKLARVDLTAFSDAMGVAAPVLDDEPTQTPAGLDAQEVQLTAEVKEYMKTVVGFTED